MVAVEGRKRDMDKESIPRTLAEFPSQEFA